MKQNFKENSKTAFSEEEIGINLRSIFEFNYSIGETKLEIFKEGYELLLHFQNSKEPNERGFVIYEDDSYLNIEFDFLKFVEENDLHGNYDEFKIRFINALLEAGVQVQNEYLLNIKEIEITKKLYFLVESLPYIENTFDQMEIRDYSKARQDDSCQFENNDYTLSFIVSPSEKTPFSGAITILMQLKLKNANPIEYDLGSNAQFFSWDRQQMSSLFTRHLNLLIESFDELDAIGMIGYILNSLDAIDKETNFDYELVLPRLKLIPATNLTENNSVDDLTLDDLAVPIQNFQKGFVETLHLIKANRERCKIICKQVKSYQRVLEIFKEQLFMKTQKAVGE
ncbi:MULTISPECIES: hypothetical protein [Leptospira]|uniref:Uncharacterized protein n=1 Tax=Leptospira weilii str. UI 13098 TaxID=1088542 RepID=M6QFZ1_9LEPT|nr:MULTISPECIES: hypothetical protein [Leptospira]EMN91398.1 hypothetical protein LEP1GSC108_3244 [Leptospira weilii str. UI 13098]